jgi:hypothetical protein
VGRDTVPGRRRPTVTPLSEKPLSDADVLLRLAEVIRQSRRVEADLVFLIGEVDARRLYAREAAPSTFAYCTEILHSRSPSRSCASASPARLGGTRCS